MDETKVMETLKVREGKRKRERKLEEDRVGEKKSGVDTEEAGMTSGKE